MKDGYANLCKPCRSKYRKGYWDKNSNLMRSRQKTWRDKNREKVALNERSRKKRKKDLIHKNHNTYIAKKPYVNKRHQQLNYAKKIGKIVPLDFCENCKVSDGRLIEAHHWTYEGPFNISWWCVSCHKDFHLMHPVPEIDFKGIFNYLKWKKDT